MSPLSLVYLVVVFLGIVANIVIILAVSTRPPVSGSRLFTAILVAILILSFSYLLIRVGQNRDFIYFWSNIRYLCSAVLPALYLLFVLNFSGYHNLVRPRFIVALYAVPLITQIALWSNDAQPWFLTHWTIDQFDGLTITNSTLGDFGVLHTLYGFAIIVATTLLLVKGVVQSHGLYKRQYTLLLLGALAVIVSNLLYTVFKLTPVDVTPLGTTLGVVFIWMALFQHRLMQILPLSRSHIFDSINDAVIVTDSERKVMEMNPAALRLVMKNYTAAVGQPLSALLPMLNNVTESASDAHHLPVEIRIDVTGETVICEVSFSAIVDVQGAQIGQVIVLREVTERKRAEHRNLEAALERERRQLLSRFIRSTSHDLRTPLTIMNTSIYVARKTTDADQRDEKLLLIEHQIWVMTRMIEDMHMLARLESELPLSATPIRLIDLVRNIPGEVQTLIREKNLTLKVEGDEKLTVNAQSDLLLRAYHNLLHNGAVYTPSQGCIKVSTYVDPQGRAVIEVADTGEGIPTDQLEHIFDGFHKANAARTTDGTGMGIGLPIARKIALAHRGRLEVNSTVGVGSVFRLILPLDNKEAKLPI